MSDNVEAEDEYSSARHSIVEPLRQTFSDVRGPYQKS
jgi:hypothetical protein